MTVKKPDARPVKTATVQPGKMLGKIDPVKAPANAAAADVEPKVKKPFNPIKFFQEVRVEARRITWPSRRETWITTVMVLIMVLVAGTFFWLVDAALGWAVTGHLIKIGQASQGQG